MLGGVRLTVSLARENTCFAYFSSSYCTNSQEFESVQVQHGDISIYLWAVFSSGVPEGSLQVNPMYCRMLGLPLGTEVYVTSVPHTRTLETLYIEADSPEDQVILEHNQVLLKTVFLDQVRLVKANQKAIVWISPSMPIVFTPDQTGILVNQSSVFVRMKVLDANTPQPVAEENKVVAKKKILRSFMNKQKKIALRALPIEGDGKKDLIHPYTIFLHEDLVDENIRKSTLIVALMKSLPYSNDSEEVWGQDLCVEVVPVDSVIFRSLCREVYSENIPTVLIPKSLNKIINIENGTVIMLTFLDSDKLRQPDEIEIITYTNQNNKESAMDLVEKFKETVIQNTYSGKVFLINHDMVKQNQQLTIGFIKFRLAPAGLMYTTLNKETFRNCKISAKCLNDSEMEVHKPNTSLDIDYKSYCRSIKPLEMLLEKVISHVYFDIHRDARFKKCSDLKSSVLVTGLSGTGKSTLCRLVEKEISVYSHSLHCRFLKGRKDIAAVLLTALRMCTERKPSLLILDDVDALLPANMEGLSPQDISTYNGLATEIKNVLTATSGVSILMTSRSVNDLHPTLKLFTGRPLFTAQFTMPELGQEDRVQLFQHLLNHKIRDSFEADAEDAARLAMDTPQHTVREIMDYYNKKIFAAIKKKNANPGGPKPRLIEDVTKDVEKAKAFDIWGALGGMEDVKARLDECIFWPIMYPALFPSQSCGILLYGPPGTGKSLIGSCLARMTNMNMITVKGPELLSKYIGQSEAAVREVFDKADMKRPCILFFDEFDSLAPKRGHDSTGVTDRVVNQLLARLDGAEGGARGPVIAATSRPDLVDPALLRTGRLQTHIYCRLPDTDGRLAVLRTLSGDFQLGSDVALADVAAATPGFSAADLKSLLVTAQLARMDAELGRIHQISEPVLESVVINSEDIKNALMETKPSLSSEQKTFYDVIYRRFSGEGPATEHTTESIPAILQTMQRQRVTLA